jgi:hypothetical protein
VAGAPPATGFARPGAALLNKQGILNRSVFFIFRSLAFLTRRTHIKTIGFCCKNNRMAGTTLRPSFWLRP